MSKYLEQRMLDKRTLWSKARKLWLRTPSNVEGDMARKAMEKFHRDLSLLEQYKEMYLNVDDMSEWKQIMLAIQAYRL